MKPDIYGYDRRLEKARKGLEASNSILEDNRKSIMGFIEHILAQGVGKARAAKYIYHLTVLARIAEKPFSLFTRKDVERLVAWINSREYTDHTKHDYRVIVKRFFQWLRGCDSEGDYPTEVKWIKTSYKGRRLLPESLLTREELERLVSATENPRDRALILTHYESGCRIGEILTLKIRNIIFDRYGAVLVVNGKTGARRVRIIAAVPALAEWLSLHPKREDQEAPVWIGIGTAGRGKQLRYESVRRLYAQLAKKSGLRKRLNTHLLRHTRATELANFLTEAQMKEHLGWTQGSDMPSTYVHLSGRDVDSALLKAQGISVGEEKPTQILKPKTCPRCRQKSNTAYDYCPYCGLALKQKAALQIEEHLSKLDSIMNKLMEDEEFKSFLEKKILQLYSSSQLPYRS
ncbi:MAG: tyrosine-type recombinase/integrase [Candidatus Bathyarchaeia archaeon]